MKRHIFIGIARAIAAGLLLFSLPAHAQTYPTKPVRIVAAATGSMADMYARHLGPRLNERWGQPVVVDNRAGAGGTISAEVAAKAPPDGYTLLMGGLATHAGSVSLYKNLPYDPVKDFAPIALVAQSPPVLIAHPSVPAANLREFLDYAKKRPGGINYSSAGTGTGAHLTAALFILQAGIDLVHVPYKGPAPALTAILGREVQVSFIPVPIALTQIKAGKVKAYAVTSTKRFAGVPDISTAAEAGLPGFEATAWFGMFAPARTPAALIGKLNREIVEILQMPALQAALLAQGAEPAPGTPEEFAAFVKSEIVKWKKAAEVSGAQVD
ncbi:MAG: tripartite tricarboxylate transporter substrate binding protein [Betaproteobacteria bacterium]|nr:tripartite tricarboxylate transporter substrate binding protein [Betaproteobacteria bacterium]